MKTPNLVFWRPEDNVPAPAPKPRPTGRLVTKPNLKRLQRLLRSLLRPSPNDLWLFPLLGVLLVLLPPFARDWQGLFRLIVSYLVGMALRPLLGIVLGKP